MEFLAGPLGWYLKLRKKRLDQQPASPGWLPQKCGDL